MFTRTLRRYAAPAASLAVVATGLALATQAPSAQAAVDSGPAEAASAWLSEEFGSLTGADTTAAIDYGIALVETGVDDAPLADLTSSIDAALEDYLPADDTNGNPFVVGAIAHAASFYALADQEPPAESDLIDRFLARVDDTTGQFGPVPNAYNQTYAVNALRELDSSEFLAARDELVDQACDSGAWGYADESGCYPDVDTTALALLALHPDRAQAGVSDAFDTGLEWLLGQQNSDGGFGTFATNDNGSSSSANSTGLAAWVLGVVGETEVGEEAAAWLAARQVQPIPGCRTDLDEEAGAIPFDDSYYDDALDGGIAPGADLSSWLLSTSQTVAGLTYLQERPADLAVDVPEFLDGGGTARIKVSGLAPATRGCLRVGGQRAFFRATESGRANLTSPVADRTGFIAVSVATGTEKVATEARVLAATRFDVTRSRVVAAGKRQKLVVDGLDSGERFVVKDGRKVVRRGTAPTNGTVTVRYRPQGLGRHVVTVTGQFADRTGRATFRVVR